MATPTFPAALPSTAPASAAGPADAMKLDRADGSATLELYRAALGPLRRDYYLKAFTRFDAAGKPGLSWNWVAGLLALNWLVFRRLWAAALGYVGALVFAALLLIGIGRLVFQLSEQVQWALAGLVLLASVVVPGLWGNAWLYAALSKKMERALVDTATLEEASAVLSARAPGPRRAGMLLAANILVVAVLAGVLSGLPDTDALPLQTSKMEQARSAAPEGISGLALQSAATASAPAPAASTRASSSTNMVPVAAPEAPSSAPPLAAKPTPEETIANAARVSKGVVQMANPPGAEASSPPAAVAVQTAATAKVPAIPPIPPIPAIAAIAASASAAKGPVLPAAPPGKPATMPAATASAPVAKPEPQKPSATATPATPKVDPAMGPYLINVGLFADANNARNATAKLKDADLPVQSSTLQTAKGPRTRVRVGPYETQVEADRAAEKIRGLKLEALVVKP
jgi:cell division septation protein DedD